MDDLYVDFNLIFRHVRSEDNKASDYLSREYFHCLINTEEIEFLKRHHIKLMLAGINKIYYTLKIRSK